MKATYRIQNFKTDELSEIRDNPTFKTSDTFSISDFRFGDIVVDNLDLSNKKLIFRNVGNNVVINFVDCVMENCEVVLVGSTYPTIKVSRSVVNIIHFVRKKRKSFFSYLEFNKCSFPNDVLLEEDGCYSFNMKFTDCSFHKRVGISYDITNKHIIEGIKAIATFTDCHINEIEVDTLIHESALCKLEKFPIVITNSVVAKFKIRKLSSFSTFMSDVEVGKWCGHDFEMMLLRQRGTKYNKGSGTPSSIKFCKESILKNARIIIGDSSGVALSFEQGVEMERLTMTIAKFGAMKFLVEDTKSFISQILIDKTIYNETEYKSIEKLLNRYIPNFWIQKLSHNFPQIPIDVLPRTIGDSTEYQKYKHRIRKMFNIFTLRGDDEVS